jgi:hypothetical protein
MAVYSDTQTIQIRERSAELLRVTAADRQQPLRCKGLEVSFSFTVLRGYTIDWNRHLLV